jgi:hypothetical protein
VKVKATTKKKKQTESTAHGSEQNVQEDRHENKETKRGQCSSRHGKRTELVEG